MTIYFSLEGVLINQKLEWLPGSQEFFEGVINFAKSINWDIKILAKYNKKQQESKNEKIDWCLQNLGLSKSKIKTVPNYEDKLKYANPESFLIDSQIEITNGFLYSGGTSILYDGLASGVKKIQFLMEAIKEYKAEKPLETLQNPHAVLEARLKYLFKKSGFNTVDDEYDYCRSIAYDEADSYLGFFADPGLGLEGQIEMDNKFDLITSLYFEQEVYNEKQWDAPDKERQTESMPRFPQKLEYKEELEKKLFTYYLKDKKPGIQHHDKTIFSKIWKNIERNKNLENFRYLHYFEQMSILMYVFMNLVANMLQNSI